MWSHEQLHQRHFSDLKWIQGRWRSNQLVKTDWTTHWRLNGPVNWSNNITIGPVTKRLEAVAGHMINFGSWPEWFTQLQIHTHIHNIYIYIYRERERERYHVPQHINFLFPPISFHDGSVDPIITTKRILWISLYFLPVSQTLS